jgi:hypothetical protein
MMGEHCSAFNDTASARDEYFTECILQFHHLPTVNGIMRTHRNSVPSFHSAVNYTPSEDGGLLAFRSFAHDAKGVLAAIYWLALVRVELSLNVFALELSVASFTHADGWRGWLDDSEVSLRHDRSLAHFLALGFRTSEILLALDSDFAVPGPVLHLDLVHFIQQFNIYFRPQLVCKSLQHAAILTSQNATLPHRLQVFHDGSEGKIDAGEGFINVCLLSNIWGSHDRLAIGDFGQGCTRAEYTGASRFPLILLTGRGNNACENQMAPLPNFFHP